MENRNHNTDLLVSHAEVRFKESFQAAFFEGGHDGNLRRKSLQVNRETHERGNDLSQGDPAVIRRDALRPVRPESFPGQPGVGPFGQIAVLEAAAGKRHLGVSHPPGHGHDDLGQGVVKFR